MDPSEIKKEAAHHLKNLIRVNTSNPPGNEMQAVNYMAAIARENNLDYEIFETYPGRGNILIKIKSNQSENPPLVMISHLDVVPADPEQWSIDPFAGLEQNGMIWGRGAIDTKQLTVMQLMVLLLIKRRNFSPDRDIYLLATADEETGSRLGMMSMIERVPQIFQNADVISEGGGFPISVGSKVFYLCETGQKGTATLKFSFPRTPGSNPYLPDNDPILNCSQLILKLRDFQWPGKLPGATLYLIDQLSSACRIPTSLALMDRLNQIAKTVSPALLNLVTAMTRNTIAATVWNGGKRNGNSRYATELLVDVRILPGVDRAQLESVISDLTFGLPVEAEITRFNLGYESNFTSTLFSSLSNAIKNRFPSAEVVPFIATGASDGRFLQNFNANVCGFSPVLIEDMTFEKAVSMVHGIDERISIESLLFGIEVLYDAVTKRCQEKIYVQ